MLQAIAGRLEAIITRVEAIASRCNYCINGQSRQSQSPQVAKWPRPGLSEAKVVDV